MTKRRHSPANSTEVARLAGVSIAAVSRAFTPGSSISPGLAAKVHAAARQLKYVPNTLARSLITRESGIVALMLPDMGNPIYAAMLSEASRRLEEVGKQVLLFTPAEIGDFDRCLQSMLQYQVDAIVIAAASISSRMASLCLDRHVPVVTIGRYLPGLPVHSVRGDEREGGRLAADLMLRGGGRDFGIITGPGVLSTMLDREKGIASALKEAGIGKIDSLDGDLTYKGGYQAALEFLNRPKRPDSLICLTDVMALGAMDALRYRGKLRIPDDVAVIGFDDIPESAHESYSLSTIPTPIESMIDHMMKLIAHGEEFREPTSIELPAKLIVRNSTRR